MPIRIQSWALLLVASACLSLAGCGGAFPVFKGDATRAQAMPGSALMLTRTTAVCDDPSVVVGRPERTAARIVGQGETGYFTLTDYRVDWWCGGGETMVVACPATSTLLRVTRQNPLHGQATHLDCFSETGTGSDDDPARVQAVKLGRVATEICGEHPVISMTASGAPVRVGRGRTVSFQPARADRLEWQCYNGRESTQCPEGMRIARISRPQNGRDFYVECFE